MKDPQIYGYAKFGGAALGWIHLRSFQRKTHLHERIFEYVTNPNSSLLFDNWDTFFVSTIKRIGWDS